GDDERRLAQKGLPIAASFAAERPRRAFERAVEADQIGYDLRAGAERSADELQRESEPAGGACAWPLRHLPADGALDKGRIARKRRVERRDVVGAYAFLRSEHCG